MNPNSRWQPDDCHDAEGRPIATDRMLRVARPNPHLERAENEGVVDDVRIAPARPVSAREAADAAAKRVQAIRHGADEGPGALLVAFRVILVEAAVFALVGAGFLLLRFAGVL